jgi:hypothetical protein
MDFAEGALDLTLSLSNGSDWHFFPAEESQCTLEKQFITLKSYKFDRTLKFNGMT